MTGRAVGSPDRATPPDNLLYVPEETEPNPAVVRVIVTPPTGAVSYGSGALVRTTSHHGLILTNHHVVQDAIGRPSARIFVLFPDGAYAHAAILETDSVWDLAALAIWRPQVEPLAVADRPPMPGDPLTIIGYGRRGVYLAQNGRCSRYFAPKTDFPQELVELTAAKARGGDSGGPILNARGELAGILFGSGPGYTMGPHSGRVQAFLKSSEPELAALSPPSETSDLQIAAAEAGARFSPNTSKDPRKVAAREPLSDTAEANDDPTETAGVIASAAPSLGSNAGPGIAAPRKMPVAVASTTPSPSPPKRQKGFFEAVFPFATSSRAAAAADRAAEQAAQTQAGKAAVAGEVVPTAAHASADSIELSGKQLLLLLGGLLVAAMIGTRFLHGS